MFEWNFLCFGLCSLLLVLPFGTSEKTLIPSALLPPIRYLYIVMIPQVFSSLNSPRSLNLSSHVSCSSPLIIFVALCWTYSSKSMCLMNWDTSTEHSNLDMS